MSEWFLTLLWPYSEGIFTFLKPWVSAKGDTGQIILEWEWLKILRLWKHSRGHFLSMFSFYKHSKLQSLKNTLSEATILLFVMNSYLLLSVLIALLPLRALLTSFDIDDFTFLKASSKCFWLTFSSPVEQMHEHT